jgi:anti-sigma factor RsiW
MHPDIGALVRYRDGELAPKTAAMVEAHVQGCASCRQDLERLDVAMAAVGDAEVIGAEPVELSTLELAAAAMRRLKAGRSPEPDAMRESVAHGVGEFLGDHAARHVLEPVSGDNRDLLSTVEPMFREFLGPGAAAALVNHMVDLAFGQMRRV